MTIFSWNQITEGDSELLQVVSKGSALSIGSFDGPHHGHEALFSKVITYSKNNNLSAGILTFSEPLGIIFKQNTYKGSITTLNQRLKYFQNKGFDFVIVIDFSPEFGKMEWYYFLSMLKKRLNMQYLAEGNNFHCGYKGLAGIKEIRDFSAKNNFIFEMVEPVFYNDLPISSSRIRDTIFSGNIFQANEMLESLYTIDCHDLVWRKKGSVFYTRKTIVQVLPVYGTFKVNIVLPDNKYEAVFFIEADNLRLKVSTENCSCHIQAIEFI